MKPVDTTLLPDLFEGPADIRRRMVDEFGEPWAISYLDRALWNASTRTVFPKGHVAFQRMTAHASHIAREMGFSIAKPQAATTQPASESISAKMVRYKETADRLRLEAIRELVRTTGSRDITRMNDRARELWQRADNGETEIAKLASSIALADQRANPRPAGLERGQHEREADLMTLEEVMAIARSIGAKGRAA